MKSTSSTETSVDLYRNTRRQILGDENLQVHCYEKLKSENVFINVRYQFSCLGKQTGKQRAVPWLWAFSHRPFIAEACVRSHAKPYGICGVQIGTGADYSPSTFVFRSQNLPIRQMLHNHSFPYNRRYLIIAKSSVV
jgi:hypothetical protein